MPGAADGRPERGQRRFHVHVGRRPFGRTAQSVGPETDAAPTGRAGRSRRRQALNERGTAAGSPRSVVDTVVRFVTQRSIRSSPRPDCLGESSVRSVLFREYNSNRSIRFSWSILQNSKHPMEFWLEPLEPKQSIKTIFFSLWSRPTTFSSKLFRHEDIAIAWCYCVA